MIEPKLRPSSGLKAEAISDSPLPFIHPNLSITKHPVKGRQVTSEGFIKDGETLLIDSAYTLVPAMLNDEPPFRICSNQYCLGRIDVKSHPVSCSKTCAEEVVWCSETCRTKDTHRHAIECTWLSSFSKTIRSAHGDAEFGLLWLIAKVLLARYFAPISSQKLETAHNNTALTHFDMRGWSSVWNLEGDAGFFPSAKISHWRALVREFLSSSALGVHVIAEEEVVTLICKVELNSFGLYPGVTGEYPDIADSGRGAYYGAGLYPTAAMFNHACCPNVTHRVDDRGRRLFKAGRDIQPGEELCISYLDLAEFPDTKARQDAIGQSWSFQCDCRRCDEEGEFEFPHYLKGFEL